MLDRLTQGGTMCYALLLNNCAFLQGFLYLRGAWGEDAPPLHDFFEPTPHQMLPIECPLLKNEPPPPTAKQSPYWKMKPPSRKRFTEKKIYEELETAIKVCVSLIKEHWENYIMYKNSWFNSWFHFMLCSIKNCLVLF